MQISEPINQKNKIEYSSTAKDLKTCLIIAGCSGAGKSTIIKHSHTLDVNLYGQKFHEDFKKTRSGIPHQEYDDYIEAIKNGSTFEGRFINNLNNQKQLSKHILMHIDLKLLTAILGHHASGESDRRKITSITKIPVPRKKRADQKICDLMVSSFLKHQFFSRFENIIVNTIYTNSSKAYIQKMKRDCPEKNIKSQKELKIYAREHRAMYRAWEKNIYLLKPSKIFFTTVGEDGNLYSNNKCICSNWTIKTGLNI
ncbi:hypothetical protein [Synechococcus sp. MU1648]|uniref:hypothetical protein n=1 Tax=Synechococcus sp. MU1648 TaxID=2508351 RepID=UPI00202666B7|nr:hypothetical protein [Synechococcus sp. MU1648]